MLAISIPAGAQQQNTTFIGAPDPQGLGNPLSDMPVAAPASERPTPGAATPLGGPVGQGDDGPVTFTADEVEYDRERERVVATGRVEAWQGGRFLRADRFTYDRTTRIATVQGNVQVIEADGQVFYAEEAELGEGFRDGVMTEVRARLAQNARMAANGARRTEGTVNDLSRVVYSSCNLCAEDPTRPPLWQMRARMATQDRNTQRISYRDATIQIGGVPVLYTPYFSHPDPQTPRASGFLFPTLGYTRYLGAFAQTPYFWAIDDQSDLLITPTFAEKVLPNLALEYRRRFNNGELQVQGSIGYFDNDAATRLNSGTPTSEQIAGHIFSRGRFNIDENWRVGFDLNRASSESYLRTFRFEYRRVLSSQAYAEGFWGTESYARVDVRAYQGLRSTDDVRQIPYVAPNAYFDYAPRRQIGGGWLTTDIGILGLTRDVGSYSQRLATRVSWERPFYGSFGDIWTVRGQGDAAGYAAGGQELITNTGNSAANGVHANGNFRAALDWRMPWMRSAGDWGTQTIEPRVQFVTGPNMGKQIRFPNEDSLDFEFNDANLFQLNRFTGRDRLEGGTRVDAALRGSWNFVNGGRVEGLVGRSYRIAGSSQFPAGQGLDRQASDWVGRATISPVSWMEMIGRARLDGQTGQHRASEALANISFGRVGPLDNVFANAGYLYASPQPYLFPNDQGRNEVSVGGGAQYRTAGGGVWRVSASIRYDLKIERPVLIQGVAGYEDECFILEGRLMRRFAQDPVTREDYIGNTVFLVRVGFKTVGDYFFRAI
ncbi:LPS-assembly protein LptD [Roseococcus sp. YIM B11640]|uniref:LPS-assembly protein LptD n=1 Tax=Roseococcus sp. YIM B11640 TaxID=3133973 RepID=UPI003C7DA3B7